MLARFSTLTPAQFADLTADEFAALEPGPPDRATGGAVAFVYSPGCPIGEALAFHPVPFATYYTPGPAQAAVDLA